MTAKCSVHDVSDLKERWSLKDDTTDKVFRGIIVGNRAVNENRRIDISQCVDVDRMEVVNSVRCSSATGNTVIGNVCFGKEVDDILRFARSN